jgi:hypothetical protein
MTDIDGFIIVLFLWTALVAGVSFCGGYVHRACNEDASND